MRLVANCAVLSNRWVFNGKRALLVRVALVTHKVDGRLLEVVFISILPVGIVAIGADHLAFLDRVMRRKRVEAVDLRVALVTRLRLLDRHHQTLGPSDIRMTDADKLRHAGSWMRIVAVGASHAVMLVDRGMPGHRRRTRVATEAQILPAGFQDLAVRIVTGRAVKVVGTANLVRAGDPLEFLHVAVAFVADSGRHRAEML